MFAISFDMTISDLETFYGKTYNRAYYDTKKKLRECGFVWVQGSTYISFDGNLATLYKAINELTKIQWFKKSVRDIRGYKVEDWSDFTEVVRNA